MEYVQSSRFSITGLFDTYRTELLNHGRAELTVWTYGNCLRWFEAWLKPIEVHPHEVTEATVEMWIADMRIDKKNPSSIRCRVNAVRGFYAWLAGRNYIAKDPLALFRPIKVPRRLPRPISKPDVERFINATVGCRERAIAEFLYGCGCRRGELLRVHVSDVDLEGQLVRLWGKGNKERVGILNPAAIYALKEWLIDERPRIVATWTEPDEGYLFVGRQGPLKRSRLEHIIQAIAKRAGIKTSAHTLRHSFATHLLDGGARIEEVQELLGHESLDTTRNYTHVARERIRESYNRAHPRGAGKIIGPPLPSGVQVRESDGPV